SMDLAWSAPSDDGTSGTAWLYDIRYATSTITDSNWDSATQVGYEPGPEAYGSGQSMVVAGLDDGTTYYFAMKTYDEMGNLASISNVPSEMTTASTWKDYPLDNGETAYRHSFAYDNNGDPAIVYKDSSTDPQELMYAKMDRSTGTWTVNKVTDCGGGGVDIAFDSNNDPGIVFYDDSKVKCALWNGGSWDITELEPRKAYNDYCSIDFDGTKVGVTYYLSGRKGGLMYATNDGSSWTKEAADPRAGARYNALAYDSNGYPGIAYSDNNYGGDYMLDSMMYAKWDGTDWNIEEIEGGTIGFGVFCDLAFDSNDYPRIVHRESGARYLEWDWTDWTLTMIDG
ncbi:MAG: fibronectin type III domain-containing protein, partial [Thermoplasmata archaeon]|nr:fibronectin type III domain-containing protein [Thermoplasmata archaeon]